MFKKKDILYIKILDFTFRLYKKSCKILKKYLIDLSQNFWKKSIKVTYRSLKVLNKKL